MDKIRIKGHGRAYSDYGPDCFISCGKGDGGDCYMRGGLHSNEKFKLVAYNRGKNEPIQDGDTVRLYFEEGYWLSCECGGYCDTRACPGKLECAVM